MYVRYSPGSRSRSIRYLGLVGSLASLALRLDDTERERDSNGAAQGLSLAPQPATSHLYLVPDTSSPQVRCDHQATLALSIVVGGGGEPMLRNSRRAVAAHLTSCIYFLRRHAQTLAVGDSTLSRCQPRPSWPRAPPIATQEVSKVRDGPGGRVVRCRTKFLFYFLRHIQSLHRRLRAHLLAAPQGVSPLPSVLSSKGDGGGVGLTRGRGDVVHNSQLVWRGRGVSRWGLTENPPSC